MLRSLLHFLRINTVRTGQFAARYYRAGRYGLNLVLWSRLFSRRGPVPLELPIALLREKRVDHSPPALHVSARGGRYGHWDEGFAAVNATLFLNLQTPDVLSSVRYAHPAPSFHGVFLWDSAFIAQVWKHWDLRTAEEVTRAVIDLRDGDRLQHVVADITQSAFTQPPLLAWSMDLLHQWSGESNEEDEFITHAFPVLDAYNRWLDANRRHASGLYFWAHPYESGIDNSPRFSTADERRFNDTRGLAAPDLCAYVVLQNEALARMARSLGLAHQSASFEQKAESIRCKVNEYLWNAEEGLYQDRDFNTGEFVQTKTIASLLPLWAGIPNGAQAERLLEHVLDPEGFNSTIPFPTVALNDAQFSKDMWRGPVWVNTSFGVILGLQRYGFAQQAAEAAFRLVDGVYRTFAATRRLYEYYDPHKFDIDELSRKRGNWWKFLTLGSKPCPEFVGWTGLVNCLVIEHLVGFQKVAGQRILRPCFPSAAEGMGFSLRLPAEDLALTLDVLAQGRVRSVIRTDSATRIVELDRGTWVDIDTGSVAQG